MGCTQASTKKQKKPAIKKSDHQFTEKEKEQLASITSKINIHTIYNIQKNPIGHGGFGFVKIGTLKANPSLKVAIKYIEKKRIESKMYMLLREIQILQKLDHPNIIKFYETYEDDKYFYICQEYCEGGELLERITHQGYFKEKQAAFIIQRVTSAVNHMHANKIVHRDLKLENILYLTKDPNSELKLIDFGLSNKLQHELHTQVGTPLYVAPQVLKGTYDEKCDVWSIGVIMFILLCGYPPFYGDSKQKIFDAIEKGKYEFAGKEWNIISQEAKDLIGNLLVIDPQKRYSCNQILHHKWFQDQLQRKKKEDQQDLLEALNHVRSFRNSSKFKNEVMNIFVNQLNETEIRNLNEVFRKIDRDGTGFIRLYELQDVIKQLDIKLEQQEVDQIFKEISEGSLDSKGQNVIKYSEFIKASLNRKVFMREEKLWNLFKYFDQNNLNQITFKDMQEIFKRHGKFYSEDEIKKMILEVDPNQDGKITFEEFKQIMMADADVMIQQSFAENSNRPKDLSGGQPSH